MSCDLGAFIDGVPVMIDVDGPSHFTSNKPWRKLGRTIARRRLAQAHAMHVVSVPFYHWNVLKTLPQRQEYLAHALDGVLGAEWRLSGAAPAKKR